MSYIVEVKLVLGHRAKVRDVPSLEGHTHDWVLFVKGSEGIKLEYFVEKVVFWLHDSYEHPRRVLKAPPYRVEQSGFAGFNMLIDIHFRNKQDPKMVRFQYDLFLHTESMPPVNHTRLEKLTFTNPTKDFREKLLQAGAKLIDTSKQTPKDPVQQHSGQKPGREKSKTSDDRGKERHSSGRKKDAHPKTHADEKDSILKSDAAKQSEEHVKQQRRTSDYAKAHKASKQGISIKIEKDRCVTESPNLEKAEKKKKKSAEESPKLGTGSKSSSKKKDKKKMKMEKPDVISGLFAVENSININKIKHSKSKNKQHVETESHMNIDKEASHATDVKQGAQHVPEKQGPASRSVAPMKNIHKNVTESKVESHGDSSTDKKPKKDGKNVHRQTASLAPKYDKKRHLSVSSDSSSSNSDMDISDGDTYKTDTDAKKLKVVKRKLSRSETKPFTHDIMSKDLGDDDADHSRKQKSRKNDHSNPPEKKRSSKDRSKNVSSKGHVKTDDKKRPEKHQSDHVTVKHEPAEKVLPTKERSRKSASASDVSLGTKDKRKSSSKSRSPDETSSIKVKKETGAMVQDLTNPAPYGGHGDRHPHLPTLDTTQAPEPTERRRSQPNKPKKVFRSRSFIETSSDDSDDPVSGRATVAKPQQEHYSVSPVPNSVTSDCDVSAAEDRAAPELMPHHTESPDEYGIEKPSHVGYPVLKEVQMSDSSSDEHIPDYPPPLGEARDAQGNLFQGYGVGDNGSTSSSEDDSCPPEQLFQHSRDDKDETSLGPCDAHDPLGSPNVQVHIGAEKKAYPHLTESLHLKLKDLQKKLALIKSADRLRKIVSIVAKSQTYVMNSDYFDFDLCSLDAKTIQKIEKHIVAD